MKKIFFFFFATAVVFLLISILPQILKKTVPSATIDDYTFKIEVAKTDKEKETGLAKYNKISNDFGMLFPFGKEGYYSFWMKNMKFPIDIIFIRNGKIIKIFANVPPPKTDNSPLPIYRPDSLSDTVLEINAGLSQKYGFKEGDSVSINY